MGRNKLNCRTPEDRFFKGFNLGTDEMRVTLDGPDRWSRGCISNEHRITNLSQGTGMGWDCQR